MQTHLATTQLSSKGQVVIPGSVRKGLELAIGDQFAVFARGKVIILKKIEIDAHTMDQLDAFIKEIN